MSAMDVVLIPSGVFDVFNVGCLNVVMSRRGLHSIHVVVREGDGLSTLDADAGQHYIDEHQPGDHTQCRNCSRFGHKATICGNRGVLRQERKIYVALANKARRVRLADA